jgi:hypothetical protein
MKRNKVFTIKSPLVNLIGKTSYAYLKVKVSNIAMQGVSIQPLFWRFEQ